MKKFLLPILFLLLCGCGCCYAIEGAQYNWETTSDKSYDINLGTQIGDTYFRWDNKTNSYTSYTQQENKIYGSDGSSYTRFGNTIQDNFNNKTYVIQNNIVTPLN